MGHHWRAPVQRSDIAASESSPLKSQRRRRGFSSGRTTTFRKRTLNAAIDPSLPFATGRFGEG
jgi:hypothetical protein